MPIENLARSDVVTAEPDESIYELAETMRDEDVGSVVIVDGNSPVGIVTDRDLTMQVLAERVDPDEISAEDVMSGDVQTIAHDAGFYEAAELMSEHGIRRLPITGSDDELEGIITVDDMTELLADEHQQLAGIIQAQRPSY